LQKKNAKKMQLKNAISKFFRFEFEFHADFTCNF